MTHRQLFNLHMLIDSTLAVLSIVAYFLGYPIPLVIAGLFLAIVFGVMAAVERELGGFDE